MDKRGINTKIFKKLPLTLLCMNTKLWLIALISLAVSFCYEGKLK